MANRHPTDPFGDGSLVESWIFDNQNGYTSESQQAVSNPILDVYVDTTTGPQTGYGCGRALYSATPMYTTNPQQINGDVDMSFVFAIELSYYTNAMQHIYFGEAAQRYNVDIHVGTVSPGTTYSPSEVQLELSVHKGAVTTGLLTIGGITAAGVWHYFLYTYDSATSTHTIKCYNFPSFSATLNQAMNFNNSKGIELEYGKWISDIQYYNRKLTDAEFEEIALDLSATPVTVTPDPVASTLAPNDPTILIGFLATESIPLAITANNAVVVIPLLYQVPESQSLSVMPMQIAHVLMLVPYSVPFGAKANAYIPAYNDYIAASAITVLTPTIVTNADPVTPPKGLKITPLLWSYVGEVSGVSQTVPPNVTVEPATVFLRMFLNYIKGQTDAYATPAAAMMSFATLVPTLKEVQFPTARLLTLTVNSSIAVTNLTPRQPKRVVSIGGIEFDYPLHWGHNTAPAGYLGVKDIAIDGSSVLSILAYKQWSQSYWISTKNDIIVTGPIVEQLKAQVNNNDQLLIFTDGSTQIVRYDLTNMPFEAEHIGCDWYRVYIKVIF